ncbi:MAG TPA: RNA 2',3'-cyclic phosphodiesterase [Acidimicrobiales bacterium]|nr:RNA 2',3'-cyclic phosphodiesterase [Acidimicrobiales bacterium]
MPRLFVAVWPPDDVLDSVAALDRPDVPGLRWTRREQWHVTLRFLGRVETVDEAAKALATVRAAAATAVAGPAVGRFGQRVLHVPVAGLDEVAGAVIAATAAVGEPPEDRPFAGHLTLARVARGAKVDLRPLAGQPVAGRWEVSELCLVESHLSPRGARYEVVGRFPLVAAG